MGKGDETRTMIMDKAAAVFNLKGYHATSLSDVMRVTGLEKGGIYNHFASKEELETATFAHVVRQMRTALFESVRGKRSAMERLEAVCRLFARIARGFPVPGGCPVMNTAIETDHADSALRSLAREAMADWRRFLETIVRSGIERGELPGTSDAGELGAFVIATLEGAIMLANLHDDPTIVDKAASQLLSHLSTSATAAAQ